MTTDRWQAKWWHISANDTSTNTNNVRPTQWYIKKRNTQCQNHCHTSNSRHCWNPLDRIWHHLPKCLERLCWPTNCLWSANETPDEGFRHWHVYCNLWTSCCCRWMGGRCKRNNCSLLCWTCRQCTLQNTIPQHHPHDYGRMENYGQKRSQQDSWDL